MSGFKALGVVKLAPDEARATGISRTRQRGMLRVSGKSRISQDDKNRVDGAQEKTRTSTSFRKLAPEASASTNSATWAGVEAGR